MANNGDKGTCQVCGQPINYFYGWRHDLGETQRHQSWPGGQRTEPEFEPVWPVLTEDEQVLLLTSGQPARLAQW